MNDPRQIAHKAKKENTPEQKKRNIARDKGDNDKPYIQGVDAQNQATPDKEPENRTEDFMKKHFPNAARKRRENDAY